MKSPLAIIKSLFMGGEGSVRSPLFGTSEWGNGFQIRDLEDGWQRNLKIDSSQARNIPAVYSSVMANARAISQCPPQHVRFDKERKKETVLDSPQARLLRSPNDYETWNQFILNNVAQMLFDGESFNYLIRDNRNVITQMHRLNRNTCSPYITPGGDLFYSVGDNPMVQGGIEALIPARDVLHLRSYTPRHPLIGESPLKAAALALGINVTLSQSQAMFFSQMSRPSGVISTDQILKAEQIKILRDAWDQQSAGMANGKVPILGGGLKFQPMSISSQDAQLVEAQKLSIADIARVFGVPLPVIGELENSTLNNVESLISMWLSMSLGSLIENIESSMEKMFGFGNNDHIELDESALLRMDFESRISGLTKAVQGGVYTVNESRAKEGLHPIDGGDEIHLQAQMQPLGFAEKQAKMKEEESKRQAEAVANQPAPEPVDPVSEEDKTIIYLDQIRKTVNAR